MSDGQNLVLRSMDVLDIQQDILIPDLWQQEALHALQDGADVIVHAPTGAGKTKVFELYVQSGRDLRVVYTVPTRALANDKYREFKDYGWRVGIMTGDLHERVDAPILVATLETQKNALVQGKGPSLLVIDEYQMIAHPQRGIHYEIALAMAPEHTQLLLLSGSVGNPETIGSWLERLGRRVKVVRTNVRPVPLDEVLLDSIKVRMSQRISDPVARAIAKALQADLGPILIFCPLRKDAERLAHLLADQLPQDLPLLLTPAQKHIAGKAMSRLLKKRIAIHHSGLSYEQRAGVIEPLAKRGQLRVVVASTGLAAGINFSLRSVFIFKNEYIAQGQRKVLLPDELLQMFGRAGRRGLDKKGYILVRAGGVRLREAKPLTLKNDNVLDWSAFLSVIHLAVQKNQNVLQMTERLSKRLFSDQRKDTGLAHFLSPAGQKSLPALRRNRKTRSKQKQRLTEFYNSIGEWERVGKRSLVPLGQCFLFQNDAWQPALSIPRLLSPVKPGTVTILEKKPRVYGIDLPLATFPKEAHHKKLALVKSISALLKNNEASLSETLVRKKLWTLEEIEETLLPLLPDLMNGGHPSELFTRQDLLVCKLDYRETKIHAFADQEGKYLLSPPTRSVEVEDDEDFASLLGGPSLSHEELSTAQQWYQLGLIDERAHPTDRGKIFSCFEGGEGLAIAAGLEDETFSISELIWQLANLRAGYHFSQVLESDQRLSTLCRTMYHGQTRLPYLLKGIPPTYQDGAAEKVRAAYLEEKWGDPQESISIGDIQRAYIEWKSLLHHIATAPRLDIPRWKELQDAAREMISDTMPSPSSADLPPLSLEQRTTRWTVNNEQ